MGGSKAPMTAREGAESIFEAVGLQEIPKDKFYHSSVKFCDYDTCGSIP